MKCALLDFLGGMQLLGLILEEVQKGLLPPLHPDHQKEVKTWMANFLLEPRVMMKFLLIPWDEIKHCDSACY
eukprot:Gb_35909 [translate_table: standard]